ncbi:hypothetical protein Plhal703r1_c06g0031111 [Plasmopara halstedii]
MKWGRSACICISQRGYDHIRWNVENEQWNLDLDMLFSAIDEDMLLYLAILGGKSFQATMTTKLGKILNEVYLRSDKYIPCP